MQVNNNYYPPQPPTQGPQQPGYPQPVTYRPQVPGAAFGAPDTYRPGMPRPVAPGMPAGQMPQQKYEYVSQKDVAFGLVGAAAGFFIGGPIGALIGGLAGILLSALARGISHWQQSKEQKQQIPPGQMPNAPQYPQPMAMNGQPPQGYQYQNRYDYGQNQQMPGARPPQQYR